MAMEKGSASVFVRVFNSNRDLVFDKVTRLTYVHSDSAEDQSIIVIETNDLDLPDHPDLQEHKKILVTWGYVGATEFRSHILYIWDTKCSYTEAGLRFELICYCRLAYLKLNSSKDVFNNITLDELTKKIADEYGFEYKTEGLEEEGENLGKALPEAVSPNEQLPETKPVSYIQNITYNGPLEKTTNLREQKITEPRDNAALPLYTFKRYPDGIPQAGGSTLKVLDTMAENEPTHNLVIDGHDDDLIIRRRNLNQMPYKTYVFRKEPGNLLNFTPATNSENLKGGVSSSVEGWDSELKEYVAGEVNPAHSSAPNLGDNILISAEQLLRNNLIKERENLAGQRFAVNGFFREDFVGKEGTTEGGTPITFEAYKRTLNTQLDTTRINWAHVTIRGTRPGSFDLKNKNYLQALDVTGRVKLDGYIPVTPKEILNLIEQDKKDIVGAGVNRQSRKQLKLIEANADVVGDVRLESGKVATFLNVSQKHSGNYYICSVTHEIVGDSGYICYLKLLRNATSGRGDKNQVDVYAMGGIKNTATGILFDGTDRIVKVEPIVD